MPGVYLEYIKAGKFVVPVELTFQTETVKVPTDIRGMVTTSKWIERHNWKEIKAMLKPAVEACLKYNETPLDNIPKSHHISYGREVSLGYLIVPNKISSPLLTVLDTKKNCWTDDEDDEDELLGLQDTTTPRMEDHGGEFTECIPTKTAVRVCVVRKSVVSIDDARRIRKELGVRSEDVRHYFSSANHLSNDPGPSSAVLNSENFDKEKRVSEWAASLYSHSHLRDSGTIGFTSQPTQSTSANFFNSDQQVDPDIEPSNETSPLGNDAGSDSEVENIPRTFGDPDEIRDAARIYPHVLNREVDSGEDPDDDLSLPDIEPNPPKKKKGPRSRKKSTSLSPSKAKRLTHNNILAISQEGQANFSEEDATYTKAGTKKRKRKRTVAVVEPMRTLPNGQVSFEHAIGALGTERRRKARPGSSHTTDKAHSSGSRSKQPPAIDIVAPDDDRLTITNPPEPLPVGSSSTSNFSPFREAEQYLEQLESERNIPKTKTKKKEEKNTKEDRHKYERLTPELFSEEERIESDASLSESSDLEMPVLTKMVDSGDEGIGSQTENTSERENPPIPTGPELSSTDNIISKPTTSNVNIMPKATSIVSKAKSSKESQDDTKSDEEVRTAFKKRPNFQTSPDITQIKVNANVKKKTVKVKRKKVVKRKLKMSSQDEGSKSESEQKPGTSKSLMTPSVHESQAKTSQSTSQTPLRLEPKFRASPSAFLKQKKDVTSSPNASESEINPKMEKASPVHTKPSVSSPKLSDVKKVHKIPTSPKPVDEPKPQKKKVKIKKKIKSSKKKPVVMKPYIKPKMADCQTQTEEICVVAQVENSYNSPIINHAMIKVSRSCDVSSDDDCFDRASQRSRRSLLASPVPTSETSHTSNSVVIYHPALGSPEAELIEDDGLFSFESPSLPNLSSSQTTLVDHDIEHHEDSSPGLEPSDSPEVPPQEIQEEDIQDITPADEVLHEEIVLSPTSPQPGCSHWATPFSRPLTPPPPTQNALMPPPLSRPPRTPRKLFGSEMDELPPRLSVGSPEAQNIVPDAEDDGNESDGMPVGAEAYSALSNVGGIYNVLRQPDILKAGMKLMESVTKSEFSAQDMEAIIKGRKSKSTRESEPSKALVPMSAPPQRKRDLSPDICDLVPDKRLRVVVAARRSRRDLHDESQKSKTGDEDIPSNAVVLRTDTTDDEASDVESSSNNDRFMEYLSTLEPGESAYEPQGDEFDMSQRSICMTNIIPQYALKSRLYKIHSKTIREASVKDILAQYKKIQNELFEIFRGTKPSIRHDIYVRGFEAKRELRNHNVTGPFTSAQSSALTTMIYDKLVPDKTMRCDYMDYVNYVLVPEAFIRIYANMNKISYEQAEIEMRFRAFYVGKVPQQYLSLPPATD